MTALRISFFAALLALPLAAQTPTHVALGDIAVAGIIAEIRIMDQNGVSSTGFTTPEGMTTILWDPADPDTFYTGRGSPSTLGGVINRTTFTGGGQTVTTQVVLPGVMGRPTQLGWDQTGQNLIVVSDTSDQVYSVDPSNGAVTPITSGAQPWGAQVSAGAMDPLSGDIYVGNSAGEIWRLASGTTGATLYQSGFAPIEKILFDDLSNPHYMYICTTSSFHRIDVMAAPVVENYFGTFGTPTLANVRGASFDQNGDFVIVTSNDNVHRLANPATVPPTGVAPVMLGNLAYGTPSAAPTDVAVVGGTTRPFRLVLRNLPVLSAEIRIDNVPQGFELGYLLLSATTFLPADSGPFFGLLPDALTLSIVTSQPLPGGLLAFTNVAPPAITLPQFAMAPFFGQTWDGVAVAFGIGGQYLGRSNLVRVTWQ